MTVGDLQPVCRAGANGRFWRLPDSYVIDREARE